MPPLRIHPDNPRYFQDGSGRAVYLTGSHHWDTLVDNAERPEGLDFERYLDQLAAWGHNFIRLWTHEAWIHEVRPLPYLRAGSRYDLSRFDPEYFGRLRERVEAAGRRGFWISVMLWNGWSLHDKGEGNPWRRHPMNRLNNVNGIDGDPGAHGEGTDVHTLRVPAITRLQEAYLEKVVETVGDRDHVLWEISNESPGGSRDWQRHMIRHLHTVDGRRHPIGMTFAFPGGSNEDLFASPADWISPGRRGGYMKSPPPADGRKVILLDTDHLWGIGGDRGWVWKSFLRGHHPIYMDPWDEDPVRLDARRAMGRTRRLAERIDLARMAPMPRLASTRYCLAKLVPGEEEIVVYLPRRGLLGLRLDLSDVEGELFAEWFDPEAPADTRSLPPIPIRGGGRRRLAPPFRKDAVLYLRRTPGGGRPW